MSEAAFMLIHTAIPREGPGSAGSTRRALGLLPRLGDSARILDLGCGPGSQTLVLAAELSDARITAVDLHQPYLERLEQAVADAGVSDRVEVCKQSMDRLDAAPSSIDLIWAEGSAYCIGVENALRLWRPLLKPAGLLAVTELTWLADDRPAEAVEFWRDGYPAMTDEAGNFDHLRDAGYEPLDSFTLPSSDWRDEYFAPIVARVESLREQASVDADLAAAIEATEQEIEIYRRHGDSFGYVFYLARISRWAACPGNFAGEGGSVV